MSKIIGNTTTTPNPRPDWAQTDETKADYIKNKPTLGTMATKSEVTKTDLAEDIQESLDKADSAVQSLDGFATKQYVDEEIATFDFIKVVDNLPEIGLPNKIYLVPRTKSDEDNLFDEYIWANDAWEFITTKVVEVDLTGYATEEYVNGKNTLIYEAISTLSETVGTNISKLEDTTEQSLQKVLDNGYNIDDLKLNGKFAVYNATGTLPNGYSTSDNNFFIECYMWFENYGRQILHDVRANKTYSRNLLNDVWQPFEIVDYIVEQGTETVGGVTWFYEKRNSGTVKMWCKAITSNVNEYIVRSEISYPTGITLVEEGCAFVTINSGFQNLGFGLDINAKAIAGGTMATIYAHKLSGGLTEDNSNIPVSLFIIGRWK